MIDRLIPGFREARTPLAAGYTYAAVVWVAVFDRIPREVDEITQGSSADAVYRFTVLVSGLGTLVVVSFIAYLFGTLAGAAWDLALRQVDEAVLVDRAKQKYSEARLRLQLSIPLGGLSVILAYQDRTWKWLGGVAFASLVGAHGAALWRQAATLPVRRDLSDADLAGLNLRGTDLRFADLSGADLREADLRSSRLRATDLRDVKIDATNAAGLRLEGALVDRATAESLVAAGVSLDGVQLVGDCSGAHFEGASFVGCVLSDLELSGANFAGADLSGCDMTRSRLDGADLRDTKAHRVNLSGAWLFGADFGGADLRDSNFTRVRAIERNWIGENPILRREGHQP